MPHHRRYLPSFNINKPFILKIIKKGALELRKETRKYICAELLNYQRSRKELSRIKEKLAEIKLFPAYGVEYYTAEKLMYYQDRVQFLQKITEAIAAAEQDATPEERQLLFLKFWHPRPRPTDDVIAEKLNISRTTMYRLVNGICRKIGMRLGTDL